MKVKTAELERVAVDPKQYPPEDLFEIAFAGRSNVGKSSFINAMLNRKNLARTSSTPGKTRTVNFYKVNDKMRIVDLPGYGYAKVSKKEKDSWAKVINQYLHLRESLKEVILLVDIRHEPTEQDKQMYEFIKEMGFSGIVIATKADKISRGKYNQALAIIAKKLQIQNRQNIIAFSSLDKKAVDDMWYIFEDMMKFHSEDQ
ncbi:ribosome biogenesis GTP-binding protein YihA/YsxC [Peptoniphilus catoniae]|uniref:ribosome biogenesis GTP-binding protein YihA/YsxC n=1 Tax=Peptoniphilus catoniae TaxID=1660341 RepID=UPI0010FE9AEB|nr:ribosome biogenesis GTP-binding protein YihA/YsxC [Peptoniphilus catoniae]